MYNINYKNSYMLDIDNLCYQLDVGLWIHPLQQTHYT